MSISTSEAQKHLEKMSELNRNSILEWIGNQPPINPFVVHLGYMYFFKGERLVCVKLQEQNGVFVMWFDSQIIEFDRTTGNCFIVDFSRNRLEYFCIGHHYLNATPRVLCCFLYRLLTQQRINRVGGRTIHSLRIFFTPANVVGHIESAGGSTLRPPTDCLSLNEMICGLKQFLIERISSSFLRCQFLKQLPLLGQTHPLSSVAGNYALRMFYSTIFDRRLPSVAMISMLFRRLCSFHSIKRMNQTRILMGFLRNISGSPIFRITLLNFTQTPIGFRQATNCINDLLQSYRLRSKLVSPGFPSSIRDCVEDMSNIVDQRNAVYERSLEEQMRQAPDFKRIKKE